MHLKRLAFYVVVTAAVLPGLSADAFAQEPTGKEPWCATARDRGCWVDLNYNTISISE
jgi:hypothetical protein